MSINNSASEVAAGFDFYVINASGLTFYDGGAHLRVALSAQSHTAPAGSTSSIARNAAFSYGNSTYNGYEDIYFQVTATQID